MKVERVILDLTLQPGDAAGDLEDVLSVLSIVSEILVHPGERDALRAILARGEPGATAADILDLLPEEVGRPCVVTTVEGNVPIREAATVPLGIVRVVGHEIGHALVAPALGWNLRGWGQGQVYDWTEMSINNLATLPVFDFRAGDERRILYVTLRRAE